MSTPPDETNAAATIYMMFPVIFVLSRASAKTGQNENPKTSKNPGGKNKSKETDPGFKRKMLSGMILLYPGLSTLRCLEMRKSTLVVER
jgi:hypothetical protein